MSTQSTQSTQQNVPTDVPAGTSVAVAVREPDGAVEAGPDLTAIERVIVAGDLSKLSAEERWAYYRGVCQSVGLNPFTKPFEYITLNGRLTLYALKGATDQLRARHRISITQPKVEISDGLCIVTVTGTDPSGRTDSELGIVPVEGLKGDAKANAILKAITKAKRRVTLSICGLGMLDETEVETIPGANRPGFETLPPEARPRLAGPPADEPAPGEAPAPPFDRAAALARYAELAAEAVRLGHPKARRISEVAAETLDDAVLQASLRALERWLAEREAF